MKRRRFARWAATCLLIVGSSGLAGCLPREEQKLQVDPAKGYIDAKTVLLQAADDPEPVTRSHAIEALAGTLGGDAGAVFLEGLGDKNPLVRFTSAFAIGDVQHKAALPRLLKMAREKTAEPDKRVFCAVVSALARLGNDEHAGELGKLLFDPEREVRMDAAMAMGKMGEPSAVGPLKGLLANEQDPAVKIQLVESLALLGDSRSAEVIEAYTKGYFLDLRLAAIPALANAGTARAPRVLKQLLHEHHPARVRVSAAGQLARLGHVEQVGYDLCAAALADPEKVLRQASKRSRRAADSDAHSLKCLAAISLGWMNRQEVVDQLHPMLRSRDGAERVVAALSILRILKQHKPRRPPAEPPATQPVTTKPTSRPVPRTSPKLQTIGGKD